MTENNHGMVANIMGEESMSFIRQSLEDGEKVSIPSLGFSFQLSQEQFDILGVLRKGNPHHWHYTIGQFPDIQSLADMGFLETMPNPCGFDFPAYRLRKR